MTLTGAGRLWSGGGRAAESCAAGARATDRFDVISMFYRSARKRKELRLINDALRDLILLKNLEKVPLVFWSDYAAALDMAGRFTLEGLLSLFRAAEAAAS